MPLHTADFKGLKQRDPAFVQLHQQVLEECLEKEETVADQEDGGLATSTDGESNEQGFLAASASAESLAMLETYNPWATGATGTSPVAGHNQQSSNNGNADDGDFDDMYG